jgi:hypothetical protein
VCSEDYWVIHFWWERFLQDETFYNELKLRWKELRTNQLSKDRLNTIIDSLTTVVDQSKVRNFQRWPVLGEYVWPNYYVGNTYEEEVTFLKNWLNSRIEYLDKEWEINSSTNSDTKIEMLKVFPIPTQDKVFLDFNMKIPSGLQIRIFDPLGKFYPMQYTILSDQKLELDVKGLPSGLLFLHTTIEGNPVTYKILKD